MRAFLAGFVLLAAGLAQASYAAETVCEMDRRVVAACRDVHGRLRVNANSRVYLWPVGTSRLLGIAFASDAPNADFFLPDNVRSMLTPTMEVWGDFRVCPFTAQKSGNLQIVCVERASRLAVRAIR
ncbi:MAG TPA: hypothetical protein VNH44_16260 [Micropepsaceae bacterium]|nr:hypothetical protein [Micropepsaceae bacterium]